MRYVFLMYAPENELERAAATELAALRREAGTQHESLRASGRGLASESLAPVTTATTVRVRDGEVGVSDGPAADTREQLLGFHVIEARDLNEALRIAARMPIARLGAIEVRPVRASGG